jgi:hypothetical protein
MGEIGDYTSNPDSGSQRRIYKRSSSIIIRMCRLPRSTALTCPFSNWLVAPNTNARPCTLDCRGCNRTAGPRSSDGRQSDPPKGFVELAIVLTCILGIEWL